MRPRSPFPKALSRKTRMNLPPPNARRPKSSARRSPASSIFSANIASPAARLSSPGPSRPTRRSTPRLLSATHSKWSGRLNPERSKPFRKWIAPAGSTWPRRARRYLRVSVPCLTIFRQRCRRASVLYARQGRRQHPAILPPNSCPNDAPGTLRGVRQAGFRQRRQNPPQQSCQKAD